MARPHSRERKANLNAPPPQPGTAAGSAAKRPLAASEPPASSAVYGCKDGSWWTYSAKAGRYEWVPQEEVPEEKRAKNDFFNGLHPAAYARRMWEGWEVPLPTEAPRSQAAASSNAQSQQQPPQEQQQQQQLKQEQQEPGQGTARQEAVDQLESLGALPKALQAALRWWAFQGSEQDPQTLSRTWGELTPSGCDRAVSAKNGDHKSVAQQADRRAKRGTEHNKWLSKAAIDFGPDAFKRIQNAALAEAKPQ